MSTLRLDAEIELGCLFATVHASEIGMAAGAHVEIDGNVVADTELHQIPENSDLLDRKRFVRMMALAAISNAHKDLCIPYPRDEILRDMAAVARALPFGIPTLF